MYQKKKKRNDGNRPFSEICCISMRPIIKDFFILSDLQVEPQSEIQLGEGLEGQSRCPSYRRAQRRTTKQLGQHPLQERSRQDRRQVSQTT